MSINSDDLVANLLDHQARLNSAFDDGEINNVIEDLSPLGDTIGAPDSLSQSTIVAPSKWATSIWHFYTWGSSTGWLWGSGPNGTVWGSANWKWGQ